MRYGIILVVLVTFFTAGCNKEVDLVNPLITTDPFEPAPLDTVVTTLIGELQIDGEAVTIDSYSWEVTDNAGNPVSILSTSGETMTWIPMDKGIYTISVLVKSGNKSVQELKQIQVKHSPVSLRKFLTGTWDVICTPTYSGGWFATLTIESDGHYTAQVTSGTATDFLDNGVDTIDFPERKITLNQINDLGNASGFIKFMHWGGEVLQYNILDLYFSENYNKVNFAVGIFSSQAGIYYELEKQ